MRQSLDPKARDPKARALRPFWQVKDGFGAFSAGFGCHKKQKRLALTLSKAGRRWYIPPAPGWPKGRGTPSQEAFRDGGSARLPRWFTPFRRRLSLRRHATAYRGVEQPGSSSGS